MNCWKTLGIEKLSDRKTIKLAYAKLLKTTQPDVDPEGFQTLHAAYKEALAKITKKPSAKKYSKAPQIIPISNQKQLAREDYDYDKGDTNHSLIPLATNPKINDENEYLKAQHFKVQQYEVLQKDWEDFVASTNELIQSKKGKTTQNDWAFIKKIPSMQDLEFHSRASDWLFEIVSTANEKSLERKELLVKPPMLDYLNDFFHWDQKWKEYKEDYQSQVNAVFPFLGLTKKDLLKVRAKELGKDSDYYYYRLMAFMVDMGLIFVYMGIYYQSKKEFIILLVIVAIYGLLIMPLMEASRHQTSLGKMIFRLKVVDEEGERITMLQSVWRTAATMISIAGFPIVIWINIYLYAVQKKDNLFQDVMSKTHVIIDKK